jgi:hypothetical protein
LIVYAKIINPLNTLKGDFFLPQKIKKTIVMLEGYREGTTFTNSSPITIN